MRFPTLIDVPRDWCATCKHEDGDFCEFGDDCMYQPCPTGVALDSSECGKEIEIRTCKAYMHVKTNNPTAIQASKEGET